MVGKISTALAAALVLASVGAASARPAWETTRVFAPSVEHYDGCDLPAQRRAVLLYAQFALRQQSPRNKLTLSPLRWGR